MTETKHLSLLRVCAEQYDMEPAAFAATVKATVFPGGNATNEQLAAFLAVARQYGLNPFLKQVHAFPSKGGGIVPMVGVDGWSAIINSRPELDGIEFTDHINGNSITAITCRLYRKDRARPTEVTEYMAECVRPTDPWKQMPSRMLRHKALIQCARYAFSLSGIYDEDEANDIIKSERLDTSTANTGAVIPPPAIVAPPNQIVIAAASPESLPAVPEQPEPEAVSAPF